MSAWTATRRFRRSYYDRAPFKFNGVIDNVKINYLQ